MASGPPALRSACTSPPLLPLPHPAEATPHAGPLCPPCLQYNYYMPKAWDNDDTYFFFRQVQVACLICHLGWSPRSCTLPPRLSLDSKALRPSPCPCSFFRCFYVCFPSAQPINSTNAEIRAEASFTVGDPVPRSPPPSPRPPPPSPKPPVRGVSGVGHGLAGMRWLVHVLA